MSRNSFRDYFDQVDRLLEAYPSVYVENYNATILSGERANLKLRLRFYFKYLLSISEAMTIRPISLICRVSLTTSIW